MLHGCEHVLIRSVIPNAEHKVRSVALSCKVVENRVHCCTL